MSSPPSSSVRWARAAPWVITGALVATLALAWGGKAVCVDGETGFWAITRYCYSDVSVLWSQRGFDVGALPYAGPPPGYPVDYTTEYPPLMAFGAWLLSLVTDSRAGFFHLHAVTFVFAAGATAWHLDRALLASRGPAWRRSRWRLLGFALSPGLVLFGMQNWDLWVVLAVAVGLAAATRGRSLRAAAWFGLAAAVKWWPALLVVVLLAGAWRPAAGGIERWGPLGAVRRRSGLDLRPALVAGGTWVVLQLPAVAVSPTGWWASIAFHLERPPNWDSTAMALRLLGERLAPGAFWGAPYDRLWTVVSLVVLVGALVYLVARLRRGDLRPEAAALVALLVFLLVGKVFSPQFVVWLLPLAVLARVSWTPVLGIEAANAAVWLLYGPWMGLWREGDEFWGFLYAAQAMSVVRTLAIGWLIAAALLAGTEDPGEQGGDPGDGREHRDPAGADVPGGREG